MLADYKFWSSKDESAFINIICFLPNGITITMPPTRAHTPLSDIKEILWTSTEQKTVFELFQPKQQYVFEVISGKGGTEVIMDEQLSLYDIKPVQPYLKIIQLQGDKESKLFDSKINMLLGKNITRAYKSEEVHNFRQKYTTYCEHISTQRGRSSWHCRAIYTYPPEYVSVTDYSEELLKKLYKTNLQFEVTVHMMESSCTLTVSHNEFPLDIIRRVLQQRHEVFKGTSPPDADIYILKVFGRLNFFLGEITVENNIEKYEEQMFMNYKYVYDCLHRDKPIKLRVIPKSDVDVERMCPKKVSNTEDIITNHDKQRPATSLWEFDSDTRFALRIVRVLHSHFGALQIEVICGLYHGTEALCECRKTSRKSCPDPEFNEDIYFDIVVSQLPRMTKLCVCIVGHEKLKKRTLGWVNIPLFDYKGYLKAGQSLHCCWPNDGNVNYVNPLGTVASCDHDMGVSMEIKYMEFGKQYRYPTEEEILSIPVDITHTRSSSRQHKSAIEEIIRKDPLAPLYEDEKELLWQFRTTCMQEYPDSLPKLIQCVKWNKIDDIIQAYYLLRNWDEHAVGMEVALDLLDYRFPDVQVRKFAVKVLDTVSDTELEMYLVQLIQGLKYEMYLDSPLVAYLLRRSLNNRRIGHYLFWHLKSEITNRDFSVQYGLLLELYCRGSGSHMEILQRQVEAINKLKTITEILQSCTDANRPGYFKEILEVFFEGDGGKVFSNLVSPLDPSVLMKRVKIDGCKFMTSAKKPLWLVFENADAGANDIVIIFKNGDDLRQDMLTLLSLKLMDTVWKEAGCDYGVIPYRCLSTGPMMGLIEVVPESETLSRIQAGLGTIRGVLKEDSLYTWLQEYCWGDEEKLSTCITNFTHSVIAYSVATYVLGVGDRHNDNIMLKYDTGQLFHIDFGHFLGNFKSKFGFRRERVKFILPDEFIYIIERRNKDRTQEENFNTFKDMCTEAFTMLRSKGNLIITVFAMLLSTGIPELQHPDDLDYIRDTLVMLKNEKDAVRHFQAAFQEAYDRRRSTSLNFLFHNVRQFWINT